MKIAVDEKLADENGDFSSILSQIKSKVRCDPVDRA